MHEVTESAVMSKVYRRLVPMLFVLLMINYIDRVNVGFAALRMNHDLHLSSTAFGIGAGILFVGYAIFEVPSNLMLSRFGARRWIGITLIAWGIASAGMAFVTNTTSFYILRFVVGSAEAGFMPGVIVYIANWFPTSYRSRANAGVVVATAFAPTIGSPISGLIMRWTDGLYHLSGWRWMFICEALPAIILGFVVFAFLTEEPRLAKWLALAERQWLENEIKSDRRHLAATSTLGFLQVAKLRKVWALAALFSCFLSSLYGVLLWAPQIIKSFGNLSDVQVGLLSAIPFACAAVAMPLIAHRSDKVGERRLHVAVSMTVGGLALLASAYVPDKTIAFVFLCIAAAGIWGSLGVFWSMTSTFLAGPAAALGIAIINTLAQFGGLIGPSAVGFVRDRTGSFSLSLTLLGGFALAAALIAYALDDRPATLAETDRRKVSATV